MCLLKKLRCSSKSPILILLTICITFEWLEYSFAPFLYWPTLSATPNGHDTIKLLIVGDPQLIGIRYAPSGVLGFIFRWDADRYIRKTFAIAYKYVNPDLVIFLGDNLDEGEIASDEEFMSYLRRFQNIFREVDFNKALIVPGDNDIGGEGQPPQPYMEKRFDKYFKADVFVKYHFLEFVKANYITHSNQYELAPNISESAFRIILSHIPLTLSYSTFVSKIIPFVQPHIILSAHDHKSQHILADRKMGIILQKPSSAEFTSCTFNVTEHTIHEIIVPTCSYRMGTHKMGYGVLEISKNGKVSYAVLPLPSRFRQLMILLIVFIFLFIYLSLYFSRNWIKKTCVIHPSHFAPRNRYMLSAP